LLFARHVTIDKPEVYQRRRDPFARELPSEREQIAPGNVTIQTGRSRARGRYNMARSGGRVGEPAGNGAPVAVTAQRIRLFTALARSRAQNLRSPKHAERFREGDESQLARW
jgi:hypothetical protein